MLDQAAKIWQLEMDKFFVSSFSSGGELTQCFFYFHPTHLVAVSIGVPGCIISPITNDTFTIPNMPNFQAMAHVPIHMVVGTNNFDMPCLMLYETQMQQHAAGWTRVEQMKWLHQVNGVTTELTLVSGIAQQG